MLRVLLGSITQQPHICRTKALMMKSLAPAITAHSHRTMPAIMTHTYSAATEHSHCYRAWLLSDPRSDLGLPISLSATATEHGFRRSSSRAHCLRACWATAKEHGYKLRSGRSGHCYKAWMWFQQEKDMHLHLPLVQTSSYGIQYM